MPREGQSESAAIPRGGIPSLLPPGWELVEWWKRQGVVTLKAQRNDGHEATVSVDTLPMVCEADAVRWFKQVLDLELLWAIS
jgi:hypothetical protein